MASMNISLPDPLRDHVQDQVDRGHYASASDYVRDLIRRDQGGIEDEAAWLRALDESIATARVEMKAGDGIALQEACDDIVADMQAAAARQRG